METRIAPLAVLIALAASFFGAAAARAEPPPGTADRVITITTEYPAATAEEVESAVTVPIEDALKGLAGIWSVCSTSRDGTSVVELTLTPGHERYAVTVSVANALNRVRALLPTGAETPEMTAMAVDAWPDLWITLQGAPDSAEATLAAARLLRKQVQRIPGIAQARIVGGRQHELQVHVDPQRLAQYGFTFDRCLETIEREVAADVLTAEGLAESMLAVRNGTPVAIRDVAAVKSAAAAAHSLAWLDGQPTVALGVVLEDGASRTSLADVREMLPEFASGLPEGVSMATVETPDSAPTRGLLVELRAPPGADLGTLRRLADMLERKHRRLAEPGVLSIWRREHKTVMRLLFRARQGATDEAALLAALRQHDLPGAYVRTVPVARGTGTWRPSYDVELLLAGPDREQLAQWSLAVSQRLARAGFPDVVDGSPATIPELSVKTKGDELRQLGLNLQAIARVLRACRHGIVLAEREGERPAIRVFLQGASTDRELLTVQVPAGDTLIPFRRLADVSRVPRREVLQRRNGRPSVRVTAAWRTNGPSQSADSLLRIAREIGEELRLSDEFSAELR